MSWFPNSLYRSIWLRLIYITSFNPNSLHHFLLYYRCLLHYDWCRLSKCIQHSRTNYATIRRFPKNILAGMFGFEKKAYFEAEQGAEKAPKVEF